jgi:hypothetical protein
MLTGRPPLLRRLISSAVGAVTAASVVLAGGGTLVANAANAVADPACALGPSGSIRHVIYVQFDNTHLRRDNANVPSDLEQMPHLLDFMRANGTLLSNDHTILISHTAGGILSTLTGVYPDRHGQVVSNSNVRYSGSGFAFPSSFGYWTDPIVATTTVPNMVTPTGANAPAPWVPFTRAGCDFGAVATANTVLENTGTGPSGDITKVFGNPSPEWTEAETARLLPNTPANAAAKAKPQTDFVGFAVHCAAGSSVCAPGRPDVLPDEPGGYAGFNGLFGAASVNPLLTGAPASTPVTDLLGQPVVDPFGQAGFPGFDGMSAAASLAYTAEMQEAGVPVTFAYISDAHDFHGVAGNAHTAFGPGSQGYVDQLKAYDDAFAAFFTRLAADGIDRTNTMFVFTVDEGDHFAGVTKTDCDGVTTACVYGPNEIGEINANIKTLVANQTTGLGTAWTVHGDDAPTFYLANNPGPNDPLVRSFEQQAAGLTAVNPYTGDTDRLMAAMADRSEMKLLHMFTSGDPLRNPTFAYFANPDYFLTDFPPTTCLTCINPAFAWNHGDIQPEIANTWLGFVGPGIRRKGETGAVWSDHTDVRPTMLTVLGLSDTYRHDGRALLEILDGRATRSSLDAHHETLLRLGAALKQLDAPFGALGMASLKVATAAVTSTSTGDATYLAAQAQLDGWLARRDALADQMSTMLDAAEFNGQAINEQAAKAAIAAAQALIDEVVAAAG